MCPCRFRCTRRAVRLSTLAPSTVPGSSIEREESEMYTEARLQLYSEVSLCVCVCVCVCGSLYHCWCWFSTDVPASAFYFGTYEGMLRKLTPKGQRLASLHALSINHDLLLSLSLSTLCSRDRVGPGYVLLAGGTAGIMNWISCIAQDTVKSRYQTAPAGKYAGLTQVFMEIVSSIIAVSTIILNNVITLISDSYRRS